MLTKTLANIRKNFHRKKRIKSYILVLTDFLEFRDFLNFELEKPNLDSSSLQEIFDAKVGLKSSMEAIINIGKTQGIHISKVFWNGNEVDI